MITELFIKQCEQAEEIQEEWKPAVNHWCYEIRTKRIHIFTVADAMLDNPKIYFKWLPTLEQLWEEIEKEHFTEGTDLTISNNLKTDMYSVNIYTEIDDSIYTRKSEGKTLKECLLKLIMIEYNKYWTGKKWEAIT